MYTIFICSWGGIKKPLLTDIESFRRAYEICESMDWIYCPDGGYVWDLEIEEQYYD